MITRDFKQDDLQDFRPNKYSVNMNIIKNSTVIDDNGFIPIIYEMKFISEFCLYVGMFADIRIKPKHLKYLKGIIEEDFKKLKYGTILTTFSLEDDILDREHQFLGFSLVGKIKNYFGLGKNCNIWIYGG